MNRLQVRLRRLVNILTLSSMISSGVGINLIDRVQDSLWNKSSV